jgi:hypothetical protein
MAMAMMLVLMLAAAVPAFAANAVGRGVIGTRIRVREHHRRAERRGKVGEVVGYYGRDDCVTLEVRLSDGECRLFWPGDLEEISSASPSPWWRP